jgi:hypothetical protein
LERSQNLHQIEVRRVRTWKEVIEDKCDPESTIFIVSCTRNKVWDKQGEVRLYVDAERAYTGRSISTFLGAWSDLRSSGFRWLILSAKYGLIEPQHPIHNYEVTFSLPKTGPISQTSITAQFCRQQRLWIESDGTVAHYIPHNYSRIVVVASGREPNQYLERIRCAIEWHNEQGHQPSIKRVYHWIHK